MLVDIYIISAMLHAGQESGAAMPPPRHPDLCRALEIVRSLKMDVRRCHTVSRPVTVTCDAGAVLVLTLCGLVASLGPGTSLSSVRTSWVSSDSCSLYNRVRCCTL